MRRLLIVEGEEDKKFFEAVFRAMGHPDKVEILHHPSGKSNAILVFGATLDLFTRASKARVGLAVDADDPTLNPSDGFSNTRKSVNEELQQRSFNGLVLGGNTSGLVSISNKSSDILAGLWVMPNNASNGYLEDFATSVVAPNERGRYSFASETCKSVLNGLLSGPNFAFKPHHFPKAAVGTWLAWSDPPRMNLGTAVSRGLLDIKHNQFQSLIVWLTLLYFS